MKNLELEIKETYPIIYIVEVKDNKFNKQAYGFATETEAREARAKIEGYYRKLNKFMETTIIINECNRDLIPA